jgi:hypothetical protein
MPAASADPAHIERIRRRWCPCLTTRGAGDYRQLPLPVETVDLLVWSGAGEQSAYALVGNHASTGIVYEMTGHPDGFPLLWREIGRGRTRILANDENGSAAQGWLAQNTALAWQQKPLAMWLPLSAKTDMARAARWYIPYFDRI